MTDNPVDLDARRSPDAQIAVSFRRHDCGYCGPDRLARQPERDAAFHRQMLAGPADSWTDVSQKAIFLIERYASTPDAQDSQVQILIRRVLFDMARLNRCGEYKL
ncbi:hypothetical protein [Roseinatronobacter alkalisoli]|uniref:Uncharacterized protein n=1 Tax=Roseinatronobacter alkalisoli TaxID=3028235 RepID=A0ABT5TAP0_9RHOB|nr:hypothetical protein [Roseinatronobacter sp. HJB301]MDD7972193.1 hypothetical protein [Roseinatronobacter sp. HJB301]